MNEAGGSIENVYNIGNMNAKEFGEQNLELDNLCVIGGILGRNLGSIKNAYSTGNVKSVNTDNTRIHIGGGIGYNNGNINNCYYIEGKISSSGIRTSISNEGEVRSSSEMKSQEFLDLLNQDNSGMWKFSSGKNNGYPVLYWQ